MVKYNNLLSCYVRSEIMSDTLNICGLTVERGHKLRTFLPVPDTNVKIPLTIINGCEDGPTLLITAGIHGGEYPGIAAAMELGRDIEPSDVNGILIMMHPVNIQGFWARREMIVPEDGKNLNVTHSLFLALGKEQKSSVQSTLLLMDALECPNRNS